MRAQMSGEAFFARAARASHARRAGGPHRSRLHSARGDHDLDPVMAAIAARARRSGPRPCWCRSSTRAEPMVLLTTAHRASEEPRRSDFLPRRQDRAATTQARSPPRCARPTRRSHSAQDFVEPIGYLDLYLSAFGFRIVPTLARVRPGFELRLNPRRGRRRVRGAARLPDDARESPDPHPRLAGHDAHPLRDAVRRALYLGRDGGYPAQPVRTDLQLP